jgi:hypothetical protein
MAKQSTRRSAKKAGSRASAVRRTPGGAAPGPEKTIVTIRAHNKGEEPIAQPILRDAAPILVNMAAHWAYVLRVRTRWAGDPDMRDYFGERATSDLGKLGIKPDVIQRLSLVNHIEIELHDAQPGEVEAGRLADVVSEIPWEYLLSAATRNAGRFNSLLVTRCLRNGAAMSSTRPRQVLFVESAPGRIDAEYEFVDEEKRIRAAVDATAKGKGRMERAQTLPLSKLKEMAGSRNWDAIHVSGVDTHHAAWLIDGFYDSFTTTEVIDASDHLHDGMILRGDDQSEFPIRYDHLAPILLAKRRRPQVVTLNLYYSGARTSRELVRNGAQAALGFLDEIDDEFAELFFQAFYWGWCHEGQSISDAFLAAWQAMDGDRMHGTSIVIWLGRSMVGAGASKTKTPAKSNKRIGAS